MSQDAIGDFLTIIRNAIMASKPMVIVPFSKFRYAIAVILKQEGFISDAMRIDSQDDKAYIKIILKYVDGESVIHELRRVSRPGGRYYARCHGFKPVIGGLGISIITTSKGVMTDKQANQQVLGGEVICTVW